MILEKLSNREIYVLTAALEVYEGYKRSDLLENTRFTSEELMITFHKEYNKRNLHWEEFARDD
jgi:hypothetical protein